MQEMGQQEQRKVSLASVLKCPCSPSHHLFPLHLHRTPSPLLPETPQVSSGSFSISPECLLTS